MERKQLLRAWLRGLPGIKQIGDRVRSVPRPWKVGRTFLRILNPADSWIGDRNGSEQNFEDSSGELSVACAEKCDPALILASYFGPRDQMLPPEPLCFRFWEGETLAMGATLKQSDPRPYSWPEAYRRAHHDLKGNLKYIGKRFLKIHRLVEDRRHAEERFLVFYEIAKLASMDDVDPKFKKRCLKKINKLFLKDEMDSIWLPLAKEFQVLLEDSELRASFKRLYSEPVKSSRRAEWHRIITYLEVDPIKFGLGPR